METPTENYRQPDERAGCAVSEGSASLYAAHYISEIRLSVRKMPRRELRRLMTVRHGQRIPPDVNLRNYVSKFHAHQQAINGGAAPSDFWRSTVGLPNIGSQTQPPKTNQS